MKSIYDAGFRIVCHGYDEHTSVTVIADRWWRHCRRTEDHPHRREQLIGSKQSIVWPTGISVISDETVKLCCDTRRARFVSPCSPFAGIIDSSSFHCLFVCLSVSLSVCPFPFHTPKKHKNKVYLLKHGTASVGLKHRHRRGKQYKKALLSQRWPRDAPYINFVYFCKSDVSAVQGEPRSLILVPIESAYGFPISP